MNKLTIPLKLPTYMKNEQKHFKFTNEQYCCLEDEYNRYVIYKSIIKQIEIILNLTDEYNNRKRYENKNIIERFVLECINHGITPNIKDFETNKINTTSSNTTSEIHIPENTNEINYTALSHCLFFNPILDNIVNLQKTSYYIKMINEYNEKKINLIPDRLLKINKVYANAHSSFSKQCIQRKTPNHNSNSSNPSNPANTSKMQNGDSASSASASASSTSSSAIDKQFKSIDCSIILHNDDYYIIKYRDYIKIISVKRYFKLINNYDKPYPYDIIRMLLRYSIFDMSSQQWSIGDNLYDDISDIFDIGFEMFASPLNFNMNMFCSIFWDTDHTFGSIGSFYNLDIDKFLNQNIKGVFFNPPYLPILMRNSTLQCLDIINKMNKIEFDFTVVSFLPNWSDADYIKNFIESKYVVSCKIVNKGNYVLHEKDKGKIINGTFDLLVIVLNSMKMNWNSEKKDKVIEGVDSIIKIMKVESKEDFVRKR